MALSFRQQLLSHHRIINANNINCKEQRTPQMLLCFQKKTPMEKKNNSNSNSNAVNATQANDLGRITLDLHRRMDYLYRQGEFDLLDSREIQKVILGFGLGHNVFLGSKLVSLYAKCGNVEDARQVFDKMTHRANVVLWTAMIHGYARNGLHAEALDLYYEMQRRGIHPNDFTFSVVLNACAGLSALEQGKCTHGHLIKCGSHSNVYVDDALMHMYAKCGRMEDARQLFDKMSERNVVSWSIIITGFARNGEAEEAMEYFSRMLDDGVKPNPNILASVLAACTAMEALKWGKQIHAQVMKSNLEYDVFLRSTLVGMYAQCKRLDAARRVFDRVSERTVALWSAMITAYSQNGWAHEALNLFRQMGHYGVKPNPVTIACVLPCCRDLACLKQGMEIHCYVIRNKIGSNVHVASALVDMYAQCKKLRAARQVFDGSSEKNVVLWSAMIRAYSQNGCPDEALRIFRQMDHSAIRPDPVTIAGVLPACADLASLKQGREIHCYVIKNKIESNVHVGSALVDMYAQCKRFKSAQRVFHRTSGRNVVLWSAMIAASCQNGCGTEALKLFREMTQNVDSLKPNSFTISGVLRACGDLASVKQGKEIHCYIFRNKMESSVHVCVDLMDMYAKCGCVDDAQRVRDKINERRDIMDCNECRLWNEWAWQRNF